jgi:sugar phosphate isomerase/epimerase
VVHLSLDNLTVLGSTPVEMLTIADALEIELISPIAMASARVKLDIVPMHRGTEHVIQFQDQLKVGRAKIHNMDGFTIHPEINWDRYWDTLALSAELGAKNIVTLQFDPDKSRGFDVFCRVCERAASCGLGVALEFMPLSQIPTIGAATEYLDRAAQPNTGLIIDFFHLLQSGGVPADVAAVAPDRIWGVQICDGPLAMSSEDYAFRAVNDRLLPGYGAFPIADLLRVIPEHACIGMEVPQLAARQAGVSALGRARAVLQATQRFLHLE